MATATMGLRRRVQVNNSPTPSSHLSSASNASSASSKRSRSENNNSPSHGNLNSVNGSRDEPPAKKSRGTTTGKNSGGSNASTSTSTNTNGIVSVTDSNNSVSTKSRGASSVSRSNNQTQKTTSNGDHVPNVSASSWSATSSMSDVSTYASVTGLGMATNGQSANALCATNIGMSTPIPPYMSTSMATFVGNATNLGKSSAVSYLDISNMTGGPLASSNATNALASVGYGTNKTGTNLDSNSSGVTPMPFPGISSSNVNVNANANGYGGQQQQKGQNQTVEGVSLPKKFQNDGMFNAYQPWVIKTYGDLAKTKTITIKKYARILRTLRGEEVNSAENSKFRFWVKSKGFHIGQPEGYDAKPADRIVGRHAVTNPGLDPPLYVPTQLPHNKALNGAEGTVPPGRVYKKVAIVENFFDIIHAVHVDLEGRPGKHAGQKRTYRTITETYAFLPREAVTRFLLGCTECQRRPRTPSPTNLSNQSHPAAISSTSSSTTTVTPTTTTTPTSTRLSPTAGLQTQTNHSNKSRDSTESKNLYNYRHQKHSKGGAAAAAAAATAAAAAAAAATTAALTETKNDKDKDEKYNPLSITNLLKKEPANGGFLSSAEALPESRRTPESDRASSRSSASSKRKRMLPEGRTPSPQPSQPLPRPWSPGLDPKNTPIDYSLPITTSYLKHQQRLAEKNKALKEAEEEQQQQQQQQQQHKQQKQQQHQQQQQQQQEQQKNTGTDTETENVANERYSPAAGLIDTNLNLLATIQHLHCQVMLALTERLRPSFVMPTPLVLPSAHVISGPMITASEVSVQTGENQV